METDPALTKNHQDIFVIQKSSPTGSSKAHRKDLERFLGVPVATFSLGKHSPNNKKDLSSFLGVNRRELARVLKGGKLVLDREGSEGSQGSGGSLDTDSSSLWSTQ